MLLTFGGITGQQPICEEQSRNVRFFEVILFFLRSLELLQSNGSLNCRAKESARKSFCCGIVNIWMTSDEKFNNLLLIQLHISSCVTLSSFGPIIHPPTFLLRR